MKKIISVILCIMIVFSLSACGGKVTLRHRKCIMQVMIIIRVIKIGQPEIMQMMDSGNVLIMDINIWCYIGMYTFICFGV